ncbi:MAG TPA: imidazoleglycerol-phosphate dehydratase HisB [Chloroflexi bacterium]|nr:imidazoleglycerol-phosphate dehydratase HisB [Chloroflexota bacterium]|tara:strand:- start:97 stop:684 length:588 start_codon:yes stop_codon:yes gene_type:complete
MREAQVQRDTSETKIKIDLNIDGSGTNNIDTGIGFLNHMLASFAVHGLFDLRIDVKGDLEIDTHHTVEDTALVLGQAFDKALSDRKGIVRMGSSFVPMDESLANVVVDLSGRPYSVMQASWHTSSIGNLPTNLVNHFFESLAVSIRANIHARVLYGIDDHHQIEALFKALGIAMDHATSLDDRRTNVVPSTKGSL